MAREFRCSDAGVVCNAKITGDSDDEVLQKAVEHARKRHGVDLTQARSLVRLAQSAIHDSGGSK